METYVLNVGKASAVIPIVRAQKKIVSISQPALSNAKPFGTFNYTSHMGGWMRGLDLTSCTSHAHNHLLVSGTYTVSKINQQSDATLHSS